MLFVIAKDLTRMQVEATVDEAGIGRIRNGGPVTFRVDAYPDEVFTGTVRQIRLQPVVTQNVVSYVTVIDVPNPPVRYVHLTAMAYGPRQAGNGARR
jgi:HlyD family secretion protein